MFFRINKFDSNLYNVLNKGVLFFFDCDLRSFPKILGEYNPKRIKIFINEKRKFLNNHNYKINLLNKINNLNQRCDIVFLDNRKALNIIKGLPYNSLYIAISLRNPLLYPLIIIGIIRRVILRKYSFNGIKIIRINDLSSFWFFLKRKETFNGFEFYLSSDYGIKKFLEFLYINNINYVVPRFFENLPKLRSETSDLDLIVSEKDINTVKKFLISNTGSIRVDIWSTSSKDNKGIYYCKKKILEGILDRKREGPSKSMIPSSKDHLNLLIYHSLYKKGYFSGIESDLNKNNLIKTNKYSDLIEELASKNNIEVGKNMEQMHLYMKKEGWAPNDFQIHHIAKNNNWVKDLKKIIHN